MKSNKILQINSSARYQDSITRQVSEQLITRLKAGQPELGLIQRDLATGLPFIDEQWVSANFTDPAERAQHQQEALSFSDSLVEELQQADYLVIASPIYNFSIPAVLKAWIDLIARARLTFRYTEQGAEGLLKNKKAYIVMASGDVPIGSDADFASSYLKQIMSFIGITDVQVIDANQFDPKAIELLAATTE